MQGDDREMLLSQSQNHQMFNLQLEKAMQSSVSVREPGTTARSFLKRRAGVFQVIKYCGEEKSADFLNYSLVDKGKGLTRLLSSSLGLWCWLLTGNIRV